MNIDYLTDIGLKSFISIDVETTGLNIYNDRIIEISACKYINGKLDSTFSQLINPNKKLSPFIENLTGIKNNDLIDKPVFNEIGSMFVDFIKDFPIVGHNIMFDLKFINQAMENKYNMLRNNFICDTYYLSRIFLFYVESFKLTSLCDCFNIEIGKSHRAEDDAINSAKLFFEILNVIDNVELSSLSNLNVCARNIEVLNKKLIANILERKLRLENLSNNTFYDNKIPQSFKYSFQKKDNTKDNITLEEVFSNNGLLKNAIKGYENRENQYNFAVDCMKNIDESSVLIAEADTGIGKTFSYIIASLLNARKNKILISSSTHNLQNQLFYKDIPFIAKILKINIKAILAKGMNNYLCKNRFNTVMEKVCELFTFEETLEYMSLIIWSQLTKTGDISECNSFKIKNNQKIWNLVKYESESCMIAPSEHFNECFYQIMVEETKTCNILIVNHALLASSLVTNETFINDNTECIIDESHKFAENCREQLRSATSKSIIIMLYNSFTVFMDKAINRYKLNENILNDYNIIKDKIIQYIEAFDDFSNDCASSLVENKNNYNRIDIRYSIKRRAINGITIEPNTLVDSFKKITSLIDLFVEDLINKIQFSKYESSNLKIIFSKFKDFQYNLNLNLGDNDYINWMSLRFRNDTIHSISFNSAPFYITKSIKKLLNRFNSALFCSATLTINGDFDYFLNELGLEKHMIDKKIICKHYSSDFHLNDQTKLFIMKSNFDINSNEYYSYVSNMILEFSQKLNKRMLVLCTSYSQINNFRNFFKNKTLKNLNRYLFQDTTTSKQILLRRYLDNPDSVLFGTNTFWEGIDLPNDKLEILLITKIPFSNPHAPIVEAKIDYYQSIGMNSFNDFQLPESILKLRQGIGRLIRTQNDAGICILSDPRLLNKRYGNTIIDCLNLNPIIFYDFNSVLVESKKFLGS